MFLSINISALVFKICETWINTDHDHEFIQIELIYLLGEWHPKTCENLEKIAVDHVSERDSVYCTFFQHLKPLPFLAAYIATNQH